MTERDNSQWVADDVVIGQKTRIGFGVVIESGVVVGDDCVIEHHAVLGKTPKLAHGSSATGQADPARLRLGRAVTVCAGAVVFAGADIGDEVILGDQSYIRERAKIGAQTRIGRGTCVDNDVVIGERCSIQTSVYLTAFSTIEDDVFVGPGVVTTNDNTMARRSRAVTPLRGATLRRACRVGGAAVITPGVEVGEEAFIGAGAVVTRNVAPRGVAVGIPARAVGLVETKDLLERWR